VAESARPADLETDHLDARWSFVSSRLTHLEAWLTAHDRAIAWLVFVVALLPRLHVAIAWAREPVWDGHYYHLGAESIAAGHGYGDTKSTPSGPVFHPWCHYPVGYSGFLAAFYRIFGADPRVAVAVQALLGAATVVLVHRLTRRLFGATRGLVAAALAAAHPVLVLYSGLVMTEPLAAFGLLAAPFVYFTLERRPWLAAGGAGIALGLCTLVRPQSLLAVPLLAFVAEGQSVRRRLAIVAIAAAACASVVLPWTARNCAVMDGCALVSTNGGWNLAIGASPRATGRFEPLKAEDGCRIVTGQVQQDRCWSERGRAWIAEEPSRWLSLVPKKLAFTFDHQSFAVGYLAQADPEAWPEERRAAWRARQTVAQWALLALAALGLLPRPAFDRRRVLHLAAMLAVAATLAWGLDRAPPSIWPLAAAIPLLAFVPPLHRGNLGLVAYLALSVGAVALVHAVFFGEDRYQVVVIPALCILAAGAFRPFAPLGGARGAAS
jgi:4-amino-4-deoxy-L-arabinose transferase-like glycosyltransferase